MNLDIISNYSSECKTVHWSDTSIGQRHGAIWHALGVVLAATALLAGCASTGGLEPKATLKNPQELKASESLSKQVVSATAWPTQDWWKRYGDSQLDQLITEALNDSPSLRIAEARVRQAQAYVGLAESTLSPQVNGNLKSSRQQFSEHSTIPKPLAGSWNWVNEATLNFSYEFDFWGKNHAAVDAALGRANASEVDAYAARVVLLVAITQSYLRLDQAFAQQELAETVLKQRQHVLELTQQRVAAQIDSSVDLKQAELAIPLAKDQIAQAKESVDLLRNQLAALLGAGPDRGLTIGRPHLSAVAAAAIPSNLPAELIGRRPDVIAQRMRVEVFSKDIKVAKAQFYPSVNLTAFIGFQSLGFSKFLSSSSQITGVAPALSLPIFDGGRLRSNLAVHDAEYDIAVEQYNQTLVESMRDVVNQLVSIQWLAEHIEQQDQALKTAQEAYDLSIQRYKSGLGNYLQVLATQSQVLTQQHTQIDLNARALDLDISLVRALGGGYQ